MSVAILVSVTHAHSEKPVNLVPLVVNLAETSVYSTDLKQGSVADYPGFAEQGCDCKDWKGNLGLGCGVVLALPNANEKVVGLTVSKFTYEWVNSYGLDLFPDPLKRPPRVLL
ncbi:MAG: hypothetical protein AAGA53_03115 [Pseudomonadota bacterium]